MTALRQKFAGSPELARVAPFFVFVLLTALQGRFGPESRFWFYLVKTLAGAWMLWFMRPFVPEMRWAVSWEAAVVGVVIFAAWVGLDGLYPRLSKVDGAGDPRLLLGQTAPLATFFLIVHLVGSSIVVPPLEEVFYRSFLYRYLIKPDFTTVPLGTYQPRAFFVTSAIFGFMHPDRWLAGVICGVAYQWLVVRKNRLGDAMLAHGITNFLLGLWVIFKHASSFW